jgi:AcrR family transcriptional regulator/DNA-binding IscR family transcriptional regulator
MGANVGGEHLRMRNPVPGPSGGGLYVSELQRGRLLDATFAIVAEQGYRGMAVRAVAERAGVSSKTFYDLFTDREDCFLAAFDHGIDRLTARLRPAWEGEREWTAGIRAGLAELLSFLDREPALGLLVFVEALGAGTRVLQRRAEVLRQLAGVIDEDRTGKKVGGGLPALTGEAVVGATIGMIHLRISSSTGRGDEPPLIDLLNELMATIVLTYRGRAAAERELRGTRTFSSARKSPAGVKSPARLAERRPAPPLGSLKPTDFRLTARSQLALGAIAKLAGRGAYPSNQQISGLVGIADQGQISRLMMRLAAQGLVENTGGNGQGAPKAWRLTAQGEAAIDAQLGQHTAFRLTARTHLVLTAVADLETHDGAPSNREISHAAGVRDQGQISKLLARLERHDFIENTGGQTAGLPNAWQLTPRGQELLSASSPHKEPVTWR